MPDQTNTRIALIRGNSLNPWEGFAWEELGESFSVFGICGKKNAFNTSDLNFPITRLPCSADIPSMHTLSLYGFGVSEQLFGLESWIKKNNISIAHTAELYHAYTLQAVRAKAVQKNLRVIATVWDNSFGRFDWTFAGEQRVPPVFWRSAMHRRVKEAVRGVDMFLPVSEQSRELLSFYGVPDARMRVVSPAVKGFAPNESLQSRVIGRLGISGKRYTLSVSRLVWEKGVFDTLAAWRMYLQRGGSIHTDRLVFVGSGPARATLLSLAKEWGILDTVIFTTLENTEVRQLYAGAHALVLGSVPTAVWQEQFGFVLVEAMQAGCPVIAAHTGAIPLVVQNAGILVSPLRPEECAEALLGLQNVSTRERLLPLMKERVGAFSAARFAEELRGVYASVLSKV